MKLLADAGIPVSDVLQIATKNGAEALGIEDEVGSLKVGHRADIVLFDESPFDNSENFLRSIMYQATTISR